MTSLGSYKANKGSRKQIFEGLIAHYEARLPSTEAFYWLGVAEKDYRGDKKKALEYFIYSAMMINDYNRFYQLYYGKEAPT